MNNEATKKKTQVKKLSRMKEEDLKQLANDVNKGLVFTDMQIQPPSMLTSVFMPLIFIDADKKWVNQVGLIYEYLDRAGPRCINGMPMFMSMKIVVKEDMAMLIEYVQKYKEAEKTV